MQTNTASGCWLKLIQLLLYSWALFCHACVLITLAFMPSLRWVSLCPICSSTLLALSLFSFPVNICSVLKHLPRSQWKQWLLYGYYKSSVIPSQGYLCLAPLLASYFHKKACIKNADLSLQVTFSQRFLLKINERQGKAIPHPPCSMQPFSAPQTLQYVLQWQWGMFRCIIVVSSTLFQGRSSRE